MGYNHIRRIYLTICFHSLSNDVAFVSHHYKLRRLKELARNNRVGNIWAKMKSVFRFCR